MLRVEVEWEDSGLMISDMWQKKEEIIDHAKVSNVNTCGWLMYEDERTICVALSYDKVHENYFGVQVIAKPSIKSITVLRARKEKDAEGKGTTGQEE